MLAYFLIVVLTCLNTALIALFCSVLFQKTSISLMTTYLAIILLFCAPVAANFFTQTFYPNMQVADYVEAVGFTSPFVAAFAIPLDVDVPRQELVGPQEVGNWWMLGGHTLFTVLLGAFLLVTMIWFFDKRWRVTD